MSDSKKKILFYFTISYPYGNGETFIENELTIVSEKFDKVYIFPKYTNGLKRKIPNNNEVVILPELNKVLKRDILLKEFLTLFYLILSEFFSRQRNLFLKRLRYNINIIITCIHYSNQIKLFAKRKNLLDAVYYSYWFYDWSASLAILRYKNIISNYITRAHGFDLYEYTWRKNFLPLRMFSLKFTDNVVCISKTGSDYLKALYPKYNNKITFSHLGTLHHGINPVPLNEGPLQLVSCSNLVSVKRVQLIIEILKQIEDTVVWTHIGDGPLRKELEEKARELPENVTAVFKGLLTQEELFDLYRKTPFHLFINCSISEGLPVSIMEAISFGIPVIATNVGGTHEVVKQETGILIESDFSPLSVAIQIRNLVFSSDYVSLRHSSKSFWVKNFNAEINYEKFYSEFLN